MKKNPFKIGGKTIAKARITDLVNMDTEDINRLTKSESLSLEKRFRKETHRRLAVFERHDYVSPAFERYIGKSILPLSAPTSSRQSIQHHIAMYRAFLTAQTGSFTKANKYYKEQELRIFGNKKGFENDKQRRRFWAAYQEFMLQHPIHHDESEKVQKMLASMSFWRNKDFSSYDLDELLDRVEKKQSKGGGFRADIR